MKIKHLIICLLAFSMALTSCGPDNEEYADKVVGNYDMKITPNLTVKYEGQVIPITFDEIYTTCSITKLGEDANVTILINGVNGTINEMVMMAYCSGLGMNIEDSSYDGVIITDSYVRMDCNLSLNNPTATISNAKVFNWNSTVTGKCEMDYNDIPITCDVSGTLNFYATYITE